MAETFPELQNRKKQEGLGSLRDNFYNFAKKSGQSVGPTVGAMFNSYTAGLNTLFGRDEDAIRDRNQRDAYLRRRNAIQNDDGTDFGIGTKALSDFEIEKKLLESPYYQDLPGSSSFLKGLGFNKNISSEEQEILNEKKASLLASREAGVDRSNDSSEFSNTPIVDPIVEETDLERYSGPFEDIYETINKREVAPKKQALADEKANLDTFPKLSIAETAQAEDAQREMNAKTEAEAGYEDGGEDAYEKLQNSALEDIAKSKGEKVTPATREELLAKYKKEFYEATGLDPSGKADKSSALMAMGLALMQNKAGKGFNVGKMLSAVGEAGEKALPALTKAKAAAKAETVAAGKYALGRIQAGESASAALAKEDRVFQRELRLKQIERLQEIADKNEEGKKVTGGYFDERLKNLKVRMGMTNNGIVFANPTSALNKVNQRLQATNGGLESVDVMRDLANNIIDKKSTTLSLIGNRFQSAFVGFGITDSAVFDGNTSDEDKLKALQDSMISRYKKFLTQETGNGISNSDVDRLQLLLGKIDLIGNPAASLVRLDQVKQIFMSERKKVRDVADELMDPSFYRSEEDYDSMDFGKFLDNRKIYKILNPSSSGTPRVSLKD